MMTTMQENSTLVRKTAESEKATKIPARRETENCKKSETADAAHMI